MPYNVKQISDSFGLKAVDYDSNAELQQHVMAEAVKQLQPLLDDVTKMLDAGTGTGYVMEMLRRVGVWPVLYGCDLSPGMCEIARQRWEEKVELPAVRIACANIESLPYPNHHFDVVLSSLTMQWVNESQKAMNEFYRVLRPGGHCMLTSFGPMTLQELRASFASVDDQPHVSEFMSMEEMQEMATEAGFEVVNAKDEFRAQHYPSVREVMDSIRIIGASNKHKDRRRGMTGRSVFMAMENYYRDAFETEEGVPATWEVLYLMLRKPD